MSGRSLKEKAHTPPKHSCFDPEELPGGAKFASLKGLPPPPCYSCGQNAKPRPKGVGRGGPAAKVKKTDRASGPGKSEGPAAMAGAGHRRSSSKRRSSARAESARSSQRPSKAGSVKTSGAGPRPSGSSESVDGEPGAVERLPSRKESARRSISGPRGSGSRPNVPDASEGSTSVVKLGSPSDVKSGSAGVVKSRSASVAKLGSAVLPGTAASTRSSLAPGRKSIVGSAIARPAGSAVGKPGATFAVDEYSYGGVGPGGDFLKMMSFIVGLAAGYGLSSILCRLNRCKILTIMRNLRDIGAFLCSERCDGP